MHRSYLHRLTADRDKCHRQFIHADTVREQFQDLGDHVSRIAGLRDHSLLHTHIALFLRSFLYAQDLEQVLRYTPRRHGAHAVASQVQCHKGKRIRCLRLFLCHLCK